MICVWPSVVLLARVADDAFRLLVGDSPGGACETRTMRVRRFLVVGVLVAGSVMSGTAVAAADQWDCTFYLMGQGYSGKIVDIGCADGAAGNQVLCKGSLRIAGVPDAIAAEGCRRAALS